jgi:chromosome partitioning protein
VETPAPTQAPTDATEVTSEWIRAGIKAIINVVVIMMRKGGAGKTTLTLLLADALARFGVNVLVVDMDPQGNASIGLGKKVQLVPAGKARLGSQPIMEPEELTVVEVIDSGEPGVADEAVTVVDWGYDPEEEFTRGGPLHRGQVGTIGLIPCYNALEGSAVSWTPGDLERLGHALLLPTEHGGTAPNQRWDVVLIDTPPGGSLISVQAAKAAHKALFVTQPHKFGAAAVPETMALVKDIRDHYHHDELDVLGLVLNEYVERQRTQRNITGELTQAHASGAEHYEAPVWPGRIPAYTVIGDSQDFEAPVSALLARSEWRKPARLVCQVAEAVAIRLLDSIDHPRAGDIKQAWKTAWPDRLRSSVIEEV